MTIPAPFRRYPSSYPSHSRPSARVYRMRSDCFAGRSSAPGLRGMRVLVSLPAEDLCLFAGTPPAAADAEVRPVYAFSDTELPAVPTGRVFVQREEEVDLAERVRGLGYEVESVPPYAPQAAWLAATDGSIATALRNLEALMMCDGIVSVEPQMLRPAAQRDEPQDDPLTRFP